MRYRKEILAEDVCPGDYLEDEDKFVIEVSYTATPSHPEVCVRYALLPEHISHL